jgi:citrate lyase subunit beta/citryl-CoA lyase
MMKKAAGSAADHVFLDLEDAVAPNMKVEARGMIVNALNSLDWGVKTRCVRVNDSRTPYCYEDIITVMEGAHENLDTIIVPKVLNAADVIFADTLISQIEMKMNLKRKIGLEVLIEEVEGLQNVEEIASSCPRLEAVIFGMGDYSASHGIDMRSIGGKSDYPGDIWHYARFRMVMAARAAGIDPVDGPFGDFSDDDGFRVECKRAMILGCVGKWAIHPAQIDPAIEIFSPTERQVERARKMAEAYAKAEANGLGSVNVDGVMVDAASIRISNNILKKADLIGM